VCILAGSVIDYCLLSLSRQQIKNSIELHCAMSAQVKIAPLLRVHQLLMLLQGFRNIWSQNVLLKLYIAMAFASYWNTHFAQHVSLPPSMRRLSRRCGPLASHNPVGIRGLLRGWLYFNQFLQKIWQLSLCECSSEVLCVSVLVKCFMRVF
jgi:hypothetical protein